MFTSHSLTALSKGPQWDEADMLGQGAAASVTWGFCYLLCWPGWCSQDTGRLAVGSQGGEQPETAQPRLHF